MLIPFFGNRIRQKRLALRALDARFSLRRLAARLGIQASYLSRLERGAAPSLSEEHVTALAAELGENPDALLALAGKIPSDVRAVLLARPETFAALIRSLASRSDEEVTASLTVTPLLTSFHETQRLAQVGSFSRDFVTGEDYWSEEFLRIYGLPPGSPVPDFDRFLSLVHPDDRSTILAVRQKLLAGEGPLRYAYRFRRGDGLWRHAKAVARAEVDASGRTLRYHGTVQDVTTERQALENLRSMARFPEDNPHPVLRVTREGLLAYANSASAFLLDGLGLAVGRPVTPPLAEALARVRETGERLALDVPVSDRVLSLTASPLSASGEVNLYGHDVTRERAAQQSLAVIDSRYRRLVDDAALGIFRVTASGRLLSVNPAMARLFGYASPEEMLSEVGDTATLYQDPVQRTEIVRRLGEDQGLLSFEYPYRRRDGSAFIGNLHARMTADETGEPVMEGFVEDITARKQVENELAASEERLKTHLRNFPLPTLTFRLRDRELVLVDANKAAEVLFRGRIGTCREVAAGIIFAEAPDVYLALWSTFEARLTDKRRLSFRPPGTAEPGLFDMTFVFAAPDTVMLHAEEITILARTRETLRRTSDQLRGILDHVPCAIYFKDPAGRCILVNRAVEELFGRPASEIVDRPPAHVHDPEVAARLAEDDRNALASEEAVTFEEDIIARGRTRRFLTTKVALRDPEGNPYALCGMSLDITQLTELERDIKAERDTLRTVLAYVPYAASLVAADGRTLYLNQYFVDLVGYTLEDIPDAASWMAKAYPDETLRRRVEADWQASIGANARRVFPVRCGDGVTRWLDFKAVALPDGRMLLTLSEVDAPPGTPGT